MKMIVMNLILRLQKKVFKLMTKTTTRLKPKEQITGLRIMGNSFNRKIKGKPKNLKYKGSSRITRPSQKFQTQKQEQFQPRKNQLARKMSMISIK